MQETLSHEELSSQLACPKGETGKAVGDLTYQTNKTMINKAMDNLELEKRHRILELGHGNALHVKTLLRQAEELKYYGLEISEIMHNEAQINLRSEIKNRKAGLEMYDGKTIPFVHRFFHRVFTVNTLYFWEDPVQFLNEIYRVLLPGGKLVIGFVDGDFMKKLPFVKDEFYLYNKKKFSYLVSRTQFELEQLQPHREFVTSKTGDAVERLYYVAKLAKV